MAGRISLPPRDDERPNRNFRHDVAHILDLHPQDRLEGRHLRARAEEVVHSGTVLELERGLGKGLA
eukprot:11076104-Alexandrium_andersonii.AAC.1